MVLKPLFPSGKSGFLLQRRQKSIHFCRLCAPEYCHQKAQFGIGKTHFKQPGSVLGSGFMHRKSTFYGGYLCGKQIGCEPTVVCFVRFSQYLQQNCNHKRGENDGGFSITALFSVDIGRNMADQNAAKLQKPTECMVFEKKTDVGLWIILRVHSAKSHKIVDKWAKTLIFQAFPVENVVEIVGKCGLFPLLHKKNVYAPDLALLGSFTKNAA